MRTRQCLSGSDLAGGGGRSGDGWDRGFVQGAKSTCASLPRFPGAEESEGGGGAWGELAQGFGVEGRCDQGDFRKGPLARLPGSSRAMQAELVPAWTLGCMVLGICT